MCCPASKPTGKDPQTLDPGSRGLPAQRSTLHCGNEALNFATPASLSLTLWT